MPMVLQGSCQCRAVRFSVASHTPVPYQRCYCSICRKSGGGGGFAVNIGAVAASLTIRDGVATAWYHARTGDGHSGAERHFCGACGSALWLFDARWPELIHPVASAIDTALPVPPVLTHIMLGSKPDWVAADIGPGDACFDAYPDASLAAWHRARDMWVA